jgi:hypothetical protein
LGKKSVGVTGGVSIEINNVEEIVDQTKKANDSIQAQLAADLKS